MSRFTRIGVIGGGAGARRSRMRSRAPGAASPCGCAILARRRAGGRAREPPAAPGVRLEPGVAPTADRAALRDAEALLVAVPAQAVREACAALAPVVPKDCPVIVCAKGIERVTQRFMTEVVAEAMPGVVPAILSGPSFAADVAAGLPTAVVIAADAEGLAAELAEALSSASLRLYHTTDRRGVEIGGAAKNVLAIAAGMVEGRGLGESARAALAARGFAELRRFAAAHGARPETLMGLSGLGDLMLSTATPKSRNFAFGLALGRGEPAASAAHGQLAEGAFTAAVLAGMAQASGVAMPVCEAVADILEERLSIPEAISALMNRPVRAEE